MAAPGRNHVVIIDGTLSSLAPGRETHAGRLMRLLTEGGPRAAQAVSYHPGVQGRGWRKWLNAATGEGVNDAILHGYGALASRWRPGDRIFLFGYSRGAYAVRSLAGLVDRVGLVRVEHSAERRIRRAFHYYSQGRIGERAAAFRRHFCHDSVEIEAVCCWDTVKALGLPLPVLSRLGARAVDFHDDRLGGHIRAGYHALALDETRSAFRPVLWRRAPDWDGELEQMWFPGGHADVGGDVGPTPDALPLANLALVWMLDRAERRGLILPAGWRDRFPCDAAAPMHGATRGFAKLFLLRGPRRFGDDAGHRLHPAVSARAEVAPGYRPLALRPTPVAPNLHGPVAPCRPGRRPGGGGALGLGAAVGAVALGAFAPAATGAFAGGAPGSAGASAAGVGPAGAAWVGAGSNGAAAGPRPAGAGGGADDGVLDARGPGA